LTSLCLGNNKDVLFSRLKKGAIILQNITFFNNIIIPVPVIIRLNVVAIRTIS